MFSFGKPSKSKFATQLIKAFVQTGRKLEFDEEQFMLLDPEGDFRLNLTNIYQDHCKLSKADRALHIQQLAGMAKTEVPETFDEAKSSLMPKIWARATFEMLKLDARLKGNDKMPDLPLYPLGEHLYSSIVFDTPHAMQSISNAEIEAWGVTYYPALEAACQNLAESSMAYAQIGDGFHSAATGDNYDGCRLLLIDKIQSLDVKGEPIGLVPHRDAMLVAGSEDPESLKIMFALLEGEGEEVNRPLSPLPLVLRDGEWIDWEPPKNHAIRPVYEHYHHGFHHNLYAQQKDLLEQIFDIHVDDPNASFVASYMVLQKEGEKEDVFSLASWGKGVDTLLPRTDRLSLMTEPGGEMKIARWEDVAEVVGDMLQRVDELYPVRYRVREFPSPEQLDQIPALED